MADRTGGIVFIALCGGAMVVINILAALVEPINRRSIRVWQKLGGRGNGGALLLLVTICLSPLYFALAAICRVLGTEMPFGEDEPVRGPHEL